MKIEIPKILEEVIEELRNEIAFIKTKIKYLEKLNENSSMNYIDHK